MNRPAFALAPQVATMPADLQSWASGPDLVAAVGAIAASAALALAWRKPGRAGNPACGGLLATVDRALAPYEDIRDQLRDPDWRPPTGRDTDPQRCVHRRRMKRYMRIWQRVERLLDDGSIDLTSVDRLYGQRFENLVRNPVVRGYVIDKPAAWPRFVALADRLASRRPYMRPWLDEIPREAGSAARVAVLTSRAELPVGESAPPAFARAA